MYNIYIVIQKIVMLWTLFGFLYTIKYTIIYIYIYLQAHIGTSSGGLCLLLENDLIRDLVGIAEHSPILTIRGWVLLLIIDIILTIRGWVSLLIIDIILTIY